MNEMDIIINDIKTTFILGYFSINENRNIKIYKGKSSILKKDKFEITNCKSIYWIEYRIDENRYWYGEYKPVFLYTDDNGEKVYRYERNLHHTKNGLTNSLEILLGIRNRYNSIWGEKLDVIMTESYTKISEFEQEYLNTTDKGIKGLLL